MNSYYIFLRNTTSRNKHIILDKKDAVCLGLHTNTKKERGLLFKVTYIHKKTLRRDLGRDIPTSDFYLPESAKSFTEIGG